VIWLTVVAIASIASITAVSSALSARDAALQPPSSCAVTIQSTPAFFAPPPYPQSAPGFRSFWHGSQALWTMLGEGGTWHGLPRNPNGFRQKVFWWSPGFDGRIEPRPKLSVVGRRLDGPESFVAGPATNARNADFGGWTILTGIDVPTPGCWELTGTYRDRSLTFVIWIPS
jgi:hypothetical protein